MIDQKDLSCVPYLDKCLKFIKEQEHFSFHPLDITVYEDDFDLMNEFGTIILKCIKSSSMTFPSELGNMMKDFIHHLTTSQKLDHQELRSEMRKVVSIDWSFMAQNPDLTILRQAQV